MACPPTCTRPRATPGRRALELGRRHGYRNAQVTVLAPTGTIAFMMDCDTTGVEPDIALVKYKTLVGGGVIKIVNRTVPDGARAPRLHAEADREDRRATSTSTTRSRARRSSRDEHLSIFDCAFRRAARHALDPLHGPHPHDGRRAAVPLGRASRRP